MRRSALVGALFVQLAWSVGTSRPRHLVMVVIDDLGFDDLGFRTGGQIQTPHMDALATGGIILNSYYVQPSCSPTRATFMTGRKPVHTGINFWLPNQAVGLPLEEVTMAQVLEKRGFVSHAVGKWHLGFHKWNYTPTFRGFDSYYGFYEGDEDYFLHTHKHGFDLHLEEGKFCGPLCSKLPWEAQGTYSTHLFSDRAVGLIQSHNVTKPLFLYLAYQGVHEPAQAPQSYIDAYNDSIPDSKRRTFAGMLSALDEGVGNVTEALKKRSMYNDSLIVVTTDNGGPTTECSGIGASNWPFRGSKCSVWEGGTRGLGFLFWNGLTDTVRGSSWTGLVHAADWLPTFVSAIGGSLDKDETLPLDGLDIWDALQSGSPSPRTEVYYGISQGDLGGPAVRDVEGYKLILRDGGGKGEWSPKQSADDVSAALPPVASDSTQLLFLLPDDEGERTPLPTSEYDQVVARLQAIIDRYNETKVPTVSPDPTCPEFALMKALQGRYLGPWCDVAPPLPPSPPPTNCEEWCASDFHCCTGVISSYHHPSCAMGCTIAKHTSSLSECQQKCQDADGVCSWSVAGIDMNNCAKCPTGCDASDGVGECLFACQHGDAPWAPTTASPSTRSPPPTSGVGTSAIV